MKLQVLAFFILIGIAGHAQSEPVRDKIKVRKSAAGAPKCSASLLGKPGGTITKLELGGVNNVQVFGPCDYAVVSFVPSTNASGTLREFRGEKDVFPIEGRVVLLGLKPGNKFYIDKIVMKSNITGQVFSMPDLKFTITN